MEHIINAVKPDPDLVSDQDVRELYPSAITIKGDGNCFYRALAYSMMSIDDEVSWKAIKMALLRDDKFAAYRPDNVWADDIVIAEFCRAAQIRIKFVALRKLKGATSENVYEIGEQSFPQLLILSTNNNHFWAMPQAALHHTHISIIPVSERVVQHAIDNTDVVKVSPSFPYMHQRIINQFPQMTKQEYRFSAFKIVKLSDAVQVTFEA